MKIYLSDEDLIKELKESNDSSINSVIDSYNKLSSTNSISVVFIVVYMFILALLSYSNANDRILSVLLIIMALSLITIGIITRFIIGKNYYKYIKDNNITILQSAVK